MGEPTPADPVELTEPVDVVAWLRALPDRTGGAGAGMAFAPGAATPLRIGSRRKGRIVRPRLLDLYCCQGGAAKGYHDAGFDVVGVDIDAQPRYPYEFHQADALEFLAAHWREFDAIHASPPCRDHTALKSLSGTDGSGWLLAATRSALQSTNRAWVIENVPGAPMRPDIVLCGETFGLRTCRHRWFELSDPMFPPTFPHPRHRAPTSTKKRRTCWEAGMNISVTGDIGSTVGGLVLGIDWMTGDGLSQAIPPAYTRVVGAHLLDQIAASRAA